MASGQEMITLQPVEELVDHFAATFMDHAWLQPAPLRLIRGESSGVCLNVLEKISKPLLKLCQVFNPRNGALAICTEQATGLLGSFPTNLGTRTLLGAPGRTTKGISTSVSASSRKLPQVGGASLKRSVSYPVSYLEANLAL